MFCVAYVCNCMLTQKQNMQLGSVKILRVIVSALCIFILFLLLSFLFLV